VLNSVNVSATLVAEKFHRSKANSIAKVATLLDEHKADLGAFLTQDEKGQKLPGYLNLLSEGIASERQEVQRELASLRGNIDHIKEIVAMQQDYARVSGVIEAVPVRELVEDALKMHSGSYLRHAVQLEREYADVPPITTDKHKVLQILVNLLHNAKYACDESGRADKQVTVRISKNGEAMVRIEVADNGIGIPAENLTKIFQHGFTTRKNGHGFGLHSGANAAKELGGSLTASSGGPGKGASFVLELPIANLVAAATKTGIQPSS
jgi:signal transduction histidine kinase